MEQKGLPLKNTKKEVYKDIVILNVLNSCKKSVF